MHTDTVHCLYKLRRKHQRRWVTATARLRRLLHLWQVCQSSRFYVDWFNCLVCPRITAGWVKTRWPI